MLADRFWSQRGWQLAGVEHVDQELDFFLGEIARDLTAAADLADDAGRRDDFVVENDAQVAIEFGCRVGQVLLGQSAKALRAGRAEREVDGVLSLVVALGGRVEIAAIDVESVDAHQHFAAARLRFAKCGPRFGAQGKIRAGLDPAADKFSANVDFIARRVLARANDVSVVVLIGHDAEFEQTAGGNALLDLIDFLLVDLGNDDLDLFGAVLPNRQFLDAAGIDAPADRGDQIAHRHGPLLLIRLVREHLLAVFGGRIAGAFERHIDHGAQIFDRAVDVFGIEILRRLDGDRVGTNGAHLDD